jgi:hypothetical protein
MYNSLATYLGGGELDVTSDTFKMVLLSSSYTLSQSTHSQYSDISPYEISSSGYTSGGNTLTGQTWARTGTAYHLDFSDVEWTGITASPRYAAIYDDTHASNALVACIDFGEIIPLAANRLTVTLNANGMLSVSTAASEYYGENVYYEFINQMCQGNIDLSNSYYEIKMALMTSAFSFDATDQVYSDISAAEISGTGYPAGGVYLRNPSWAWDAVYNRATLSLSKPVAWTNLNPVDPISYAVLYIPNASNLLIYYNSLGGSYDPNGNSFIIKPNTSGIFNITV